MKNRRVILQQAVPAEVRGDPIFGAMLDDWQHIFDGCNRRRADALDRKLRAAGLDPQVVWTAVSLATSAALATVYARRGREEETRH